MAQNGADGQLAIVARLLRSRRQVVRIAVLFVVLGVVKLACLLAGTTPSRLRTLAANAVSQALGLASRRRRLLDPVFGIDLRTEDMGHAWEVFLDGLSFQPESPIRAHIRQLFGRPEFDEQLRELFDVLSDGAARLTFSQFERFSRGIRGHLHVLLQTSSKVPVVEVKAEEMKWMAEHFDGVFPLEQPLDRVAFPAFAKLVLLRRVVRTLAESIGLERLQQGMTQPLVIEVMVDLGSACEPFRLHTVAPRSARGMSSGQSLALISEDEDG